MCFVLLVRVWRTRVFLCVVIGVDVCEFVFCRDCVWTFVHLPGCELLCRVFVMAHSCARVW